MVGEFLDRFRQKGPGRPRSKAETEKRRRLLIVLLIVLAVVSSVSVVGYGYYDTNVRPWHGRILKVNGTVFEMRYFVKVLRLYGITSSEYVQYAVSAMEENELKKQYLESEFGVAIDDEAVDEKFREQLTDSLVAQGTISENATEEEYQEAYKGWRDTQRKAGLSERDWKDVVVAPQLVEEELLKWIGDRDYPVDRLVEHAQVQALLIQGSDNATAVRNQWMAAADPDAEFQLLAADNATYAPVRKYLKTTGDNTTVLWVPRGIESTAFDNYTFSAELGSGLSEPIRDSDTSENYWVVKVLAREQRLLSESDRATLTNAALTKWLEAAKISEDNVIVHYLDKKGGQAKLAWAVDHAVVSKS